ncbi:unnamed protein product [Phytomonas sp. EM1]|nr:unnamed protein product [Phytomonas sp. EM1]|eukprot:CCW65062.1 unnamed protein product [Phytomonas sp. isolate EM1]
MRRDGEGGGVAFATQLAWAGRVLTADGVVEVEHVFNTPFEFVYTDGPGATGLVRLVVTAFSQGSDGGDPPSSVGYCCVSLPSAVPGRHRVQSPMWAPHRTGEEYVQSALVGGAPSLVDAWESGPPLSGQTGIGVKLGLTTDGVGTLHLTLNVIHQRSC